jgi:hypothetical protein
MYLKFYNPIFFLKVVDYNLKVVGLQLQTVSKMRICYILMSFYKSKRGGLQLPQMPHQTVFSGVSFPVYSKQIIFQRYDHARVCVESTQCAVRRSRGQWNSNGV